MILHIRKLALGTALLAATPLIARATPACGGSSFSTCASVTITKVLLTNGNVRVRIEVMNQAGLAGTDERTRLTYIGLRNLPLHAQYVDSSLTVGGSQIRDDWRLARAVESDSEDSPFRLRDDLRGVRVAKPWEIRGLSTGEVAAYEFDLTGVAYDDVDVHAWELHGEIGSGDCVTQMVATNGSVNEPRIQSNLCAATVTPEPGTLLLFATGLAGGAGFLRIRRRRRAH
jgi:hypothetical protein